MADGKWIEGLTREMPVHDAARIVFTTRFAVVRDTLPAAVERFVEDVEHVHRLRVGTRRAGAALRLLADDLPEKWTKAAKKSLRALRRAAGDARDWDVFILALAESKPLTTAAGKPTLDFLLGYALNERARAQQALVEASAHAGPEFYHLCEQLPATIERHRTSNSDTLGDLADERMQSLFAEFRTALDANPTAPADLHQLRIRGKHVRYAMELFTGCFPPAFKDVQYPAIESLQEILGAMQDAHVGLSRLESIRSHVQQIMPAEWTRLRTGITGLITALKRKLPAGRKQFQTWRTAWKKSERAK